MTDKTFRIELGDTTPTLDVACINENGNIVNVTGSTVTFQLRLLGGGLLFSRPGTIVNATSGHIRYTWQPGDTNTAGRYLGRFVVTFPSATVVEFPDDRYIRIEIES